MTDKTFKLNNGQQMPAVGFGRPPHQPTPPSSHLQSDRVNGTGLTTAILTGTWKAEPGKVKEAVAHAVKSGYRLIDCAYCYGNEDEVGEGLKEAFASGVKREDVFIMTKAWATYNTRLELALEKSLKSLGLDYIDLFLIVSSPRGVSIGASRLTVWQHWPVLANPEGRIDDEDVLKDRD